MKNKINFEKVETQESTTTKKTHVKKCKRTEQKRKNCKVCKCHKERRQKVYKIIALNHSIYFRHFSAEMVLYIVLYEPIVLKTKRKRLS